MIESTAAMARKCIGTSIRETREGVSERQPAMRATQRPAEQNDRRRD